MTIQGLGRVPSTPDSRDYQMAAAVQVLEQLPAVPDRHWQSSVVLNQGATERCVGYSWAGWGISAPIQDRWTNADGDRIYAACKVVDGQPGQQNGSSVRSGAKVMKSAGRIGTYFFASSVDEAANYVSRFGPVVLGTDWYAGMYSPNPTTGLIVPTGKVIGGHAYLWIGIHKGCAVIRNSWGAKWGIGGEALIKLTDLRTIFKHYGEAAAATERPLNLKGVAPLLPKMDKPDF